MRDPLISVIVPIYNVEAYLPKCLDSIISQSYQNLEVVLVDDGSPDRCGVICDEYAAKDCRIKVIHKENAGVTKARITGLDNSSGLYVAFIDSDDYISKDFVKHLYENMVKYDVDVSCCQLINVFKNRQIRDSRQEVGLFGKQRLEKFLSTNFLYDYNTGTAGFFVGQGGKMYKKEFLPNALAAGLNLKMGEDILMLFDLMQKINSMYVSSSYLYYYVQHNSQATRNFDMKTWRNLIDEWEKILEYDKKKYLTDQLAYRIMRHLRYFSVYNLNNNWTYGNFVLHIKQLVEPQIINVFLYGYKFEHLTLLDKFFFFFLKNKYTKLLYLFCIVLFQGVIIKKLVKHTQIQ